jgi:hypothetical protein
MAIRLVEAFRVDVATFSLTHRVPCDQLPPGLLCLAGRRADQLVYPRKPVQKCFSGSIRDECLNEHRFLSLSDAQRKIEKWRVEYNTWPHLSLGQKAPASFAARVEGSQALTPELA